jgi:hypothetical protein
MLHIQCHRLRASSKTLSPPTEETPHSWGRWAMIRIYSLVTPKYCHVPGICVTNNNGFWIWWSNVLTFIQLVTTVHKPPSDTPASSSTGHSRLLTTLYYSCVLRHVFWLCPLIIPRHGPTENTVFRCQECMFIGALPTNGCPSIVKLVCIGNVFTEPLPSNGHMRHNIYTLTFISSSTQ